MSENSVLELDYFLDNEQKEYLDDHSKKYPHQVLQLRKQFIQSSYDKLSFFTKDNYEIDLSVIEAEQKKDFSVSEQIRSLNDSSVVCAKWGFTVKCECGSLNQSPIFCGERKLCPICNKNYSRRLMKSIYRVLTLIPDSWWSEVVLTYPKNHFDEEHLTKTDIIKLMLKSANTWIKKTYGKKTGCVMVCHSNNTKNPLSSSNNFHVHILIPDFVFSPVIEKTLVPYEKTTVDMKEGTVKTFFSSDRAIKGYGELKRIKFHKSKEEIIKNRKAWADIIKHTKSDVNVWFEYFNCKKKLMHKINYVVRGAVKDFNDYFLLKENQNRQMTFEERKKFYYHVDFPSGFNRVRWYGFLCNSQRGKFLKTVANFELIKMLDPIYETFEVCVVCFRRFNGVGSEEMVFDKETMKRTLRMDLITYENYRKLHNCKMKTD